MLGKQCWIPSICWCWVFLMLYDKRSTECLLQYLAGRSVNGFFSYIITVVLVQKEDFKLMEKFMCCWFRINTQRKRKTLLDVAYDTGNYETVDKLLRYQTTNELVVACLACDVVKVNEFVKMRFGKSRAFLK